MNWLFHRSTFNVCTLLVVTLLFGCNDSDDSNDPGSQDSEPGYVRGTVVDSRDNALPGVSIILDNTVFGNTYVTAVTDERGEYKINVPNIGVWAAYATHIFQYDGLEYEMYLRPDTAEGFVANESVVRDFTWELTGKKPLPLWGYFGGSIEIVKGIGSKIFDPRNIIFTFTPTAPLIDGSTGEVIITKCDSDNKIQDLPMGRYKITAEYHAAEGVTPVLLSDYFTQSEFARELELPFSPHTPLCDNCMILLYKEVI